MGAENMSIDSNESTNEVLLSSLQQIEAEKINLQSRVDRMKILLTWASKINTFSRWGEREELYLLKTGFPRESLLLVEAQKRLESWQKIPSAIQQEYMDIYKKNGMIVDHIYSAMKNTSPVYQKLLVKNLNEIEFGLLNSCTKNNSKEQCEFALMAANEALKVQPKWYELNPALIGRKGFALQKLAQVEKDPIQKQKYLNEAIECYDSAIEIHLKNHKGNDINYQNLNKLREEVHVQAVELQAQDIGSQVKQGKQKSKKQG